MTPAAEAPRVIRSASNPLVVRLRRERREPGAYRHTGELWLEGEHLCDAWLQAGRPVLQQVFSESAWAARSPASLPALAPGAERLLLADALFDSVSQLPSPTGIALRVPLPAAPSPQPGLPTLVLDRLQDPGNVGSLLRTAAAMGLQQVVALAGTVALWSPKVVRAGQGAHLTLRLVEGLAPEALAQLRLPLVAAGSHEAQPLHRVRLPWPLAWVLGHEGQGIAAALRPLCAFTVAIEQPGGQESLNVAVAGAICLYESARQRSMAVGDPAPTAGATAALPPLAR